MHWQMILSRYQRQLGRIIRMLKGANSRGQIVVGARAGGVVLATAAVLTVHAHMAFGEDRGIGEYQLKAAFLYNFAKFIEWPAAAFPSPEAHFRLCVLGSEAFIAAQQVLRDKTVRGRPLELRHVHSVAEGKRCHLLFVAASESAWAEAVLDGVAGHTVTVGESNDFTRSGGVINLVRNDNRIRFEIARRTAERSGFKFSAQLLNLAILVDHGR